jgi:hypothetical protein
MFSFSFDVTKMDAMMIRNDWNNRLVADFSEVTRDFSFAVSADYMTV